MNNICNTLNVTALLFISIPIKEYNILLYITTKRIHHIHIYFTPTNK